MANYSITVKDSSGSPMAGAKIFVTDANYKHLVEVPFTADAAGQFTVTGFTPAQPQFYVSVEATGYQPTHAVLKPGDNAITLYKEGLVGTMDKYKMWIIILLLIVAVYFAWKHKVWTKLKL